MMEQSQYSIVRVKRHVHRDLKIVAALTGETLMDVIERLAQQERARMDQRGRMTAESVEVTPI